MAVSVWKKNYAHFFVRWAQLNLFTFIFSKQEKENPFFLYYKVISANRITARCLTRTNLFFSNSDPFTQSCGGDRAKVKSSQLKYVFKSSSRVGGGIWSTKKPFIAKQVKYLASAKSPLSLQFRSSPMNTRLFLSLLWKLEKLITIFQKIQICFQSSVEQQILAVIKNKRQVCVVVLTIFILILISLYTILTMVRFSQFQ